MHHATLAFGHMREKEAEARRNTINEELHRLRATQGTTTIIKSRGMKWEGAWEQEAQNLKENMILIFLDT
jgi:hypothetical protein